MSLMSSSIPLTIYRADPSFLNALTFDKLKQFAFRPIDNLPEKKGWGFTNFDDMFDVGWTKSVPEKGQYFTFGFRIDSRTVPPSIIKKHYAEMEAEELERIKAGGKKFLSRERKKELRVLCKSRLLSRTEPRPAMYGVAVNIKTGLVYVACVSKTVLELLESYLKTAFSSVPERIFPDTLSTLASEHPFEAFLRDLYIESMMLSLNAHKYHVAEQGKATLAQENGPSVSVNDAPDSARAGLESGLHIKSLKLRLSLMPEEEQVSTFTLHSDFSFTGLKTPRVKREKGDSDPDTLFLLKINYIEEIVSVMHSLFRQFCGEKK